MIAVYPQTKHLADVYEYWCENTFQSHWQLTLVYDTQDYWGFGICPLPGILKSKKEYNLSEADPIAEVSFL